MVPRKGYDVLIAALARLEDLSWRLVIAGDGARSPETLRQLETDIARLGLADRITMRGAVAAEQLAALYASSDLFVLPSRFEGYGMAYAEAIAHGLPVVGTTAGAIPETVPADAGVLVPPDDVAALAAALRRLIESPAARERLAAGARAARFPSWSEQAALLRPRAGRSRMSGFSAEWLALREPYDLAARNAAVLDAVADAFLDRARRSRSSISPAAPARRCVPIGPHLPPRQSWRLVDNDLGLLREGLGAGKSAACDVVAKPVDLVRDLELALDGPLDLVTASALLDLVSPRMARSPHHRSGGAAAAGLCGAQL